MDFKLIFTEANVNLVLNGLAELPAKVSMNLINTLQVECNKQVEAAKEDKE